MEMYMARYKDITGQKFHRLTALYPVEGVRPMKWHCVCECGAEVDVDAGSLRRGDTKSCGCYRRELHRTHGMSRSKLHGVWSGILQRCYYDKHIDNKWYSQKGLEVCEEWRCDFKVFYEWAMMTGYREGLTLDRIDNDLGYSPDNCRWRTPQEQANNRSTNIRIEYNGKTQTLKQWASELGINYSKLYGRIKRGVPFQDAIK